MTPDQIIMCSLAKQATWLEILAVMAALLFERQSQNCTHCAFNMSAIFLEGVLP